MKKFRHLRKDLGEELQFKVDVEGMPPTFMNGRSSAEILAKLRKIVKQPSMIKSVERYTTHDVKKAYRNKAQGREMDEAVTYYGNPNKDDDARNAARRKRLAKQDKKPKPQTEASVVPSPDGKSLVPMRKAPEPKAKPVPNSQFGLPRLKEISQDLKKRYTDKATSDYHHQKFSADIAKDMGASDAEKHYRRKQYNRVAGIAKAK